MRRLLILLLALVAGAAGAADVADEAEFHFRRGLAFQRQGRFDDALAEFYASNRLVPNRNVQLNIASTLGRLQLYDEAFRAYSEVARQPLEPDERADVEQALAFLRPKLALVRVESTPPGATIFIGRRDLGALGVTPKTLALKPGRHRILLDLEGYRSREVEVDVARGREVVATGELELIVGGLEIRDVPEGAEVRREDTDEVLRTGPGEVMGLRPGRVPLRVVAPGFLPTRLDVEVVADQLRPVHLPLIAEPPPPRRVGSLVVRANVDGAVVLVDGREVGFTPAVIESVDAGRRVVEVQHEGLEPFRAEVDLEDRQLRSLDAHLRPKRLEVAGATQRLIHLEDAPASTTIITAEELRMFGYRTVAEALRSVRSLQVWTDRLYDSVGMRGFGWPENANARILVLLNGHPLNDVVRGYGPLGMDLGIDMSQVERIEVVRGEGMVFGSTAFLGMINVVTRRAEEGVHVRFGMGADTLRGTDLQAMASGRRGATELVVLAGNQYREGDPLPAPTGVGLLSDEESVERAFVLGRYGGFSLTSGIIRRAKHVPSSFVWTEGQPVLATDLRRFASLQYDHTFPGGSFLLSRVAIDDMDYSLRSQPVQAPVLPREETGYGLGLSVESRFEWARSSTSRLIAGASLRRAMHLDGQLSLGDGTEAELYSGTRTELTFYGSYEWTPRPWFLLHFGSRISPFRVTSADTNDPFELVFTLSPVLAMVSKPYEGGSLKFTTGVTGRGPSERELRYDFEDFERLAPLSLVPESHFATALEHTHTVSEETSLIAAVFLNAYADIARTASEQALPFRYSNSGPHVLGGAEVELRYAPGTGQLVSISGYVQARLDSPEDAVREGFDGDLEPHVVNSAEHAISARFGLPVLRKGLVAGTELVFTGARFDSTGLRVPESLYVNLMLSGQFTPWRLRYYGGVYNMLDERRPNPVSPDFGRTTVPQYGREVRLGASISF
ncbi:PEGA domain-containing protein [Hyalangium gracile]|uniref:PEGA domain-containing protein n=1 Tax=Hyalangium gracile TaxID=394092 RepID=UPI001CCA9202|nr:PEGA domain-containing protein [Hyalangium gracile]